MLAVHYAQREPLFADVLEKDATIDPFVVEKMLKEDNRIGAIVAVHLYGHSVDVEALRDICSRHDVLLIEDMAQAMGGKYSNGSLFGTIGDCSVVSFGHTKILDVGGGGAFLTDDEVMTNRIRSLCSLLPPPPDNKEQLSSMYHKLYYSIWECGQVEPSFFKLFDHFPFLFHALHVHRISDTLASKILEALPLLDLEITHRGRIAALYESKLRGCAQLKFFRPTGHVVPWRFTFRIDGHLRDVVLEEVRSAGYDISSWYPSITEWTPAGRIQGKESFPVANRLEKEVVNLWVSTDYNEKKAEAVAGVIRRTISRACVPIT
jgi:dTDP-4-amino-4,6-dideoxygalactose transaminase